MLNATGTVFMAPSFPNQGLMPFNVITFANTCHALGYSAYLLLDALLFFRWSLRAPEMRLSVRVLN